MTVDNVSLGKRIRFTRKKKKMSMETLAEKTEVSPMLISLIERGQSLGSIDTLVSIANALEVSVDRLLTDSLQTSGNRDEEDFSYLLLDCNERESKVIIKNAENLKTLLKKYLQK